MGDESYRGACTNFTHFQNRMTFLAQIAAFACETKGEKGNLIWMPYCKKTTFVPFFLFSI